MGDGRYLATKDIAVIALFSGIWSILNFTISPYIWQMTRLPIACDMIGFSSLIIAIYLTRKPGIGSVIGLVSTFMTLFLRPDAIYFFGFTLGSIAFDLISATIGYEEFFRNDFHGLLMITFTSAGSAALAGLIIGRFFMALSEIISLLIFSILHAIGGFIAGIIGRLVLFALLRRKL